MCLTPAPQFPLSASSAVLLWFLSLLKRFTYRPLPAQVSCFILSLTFRMFFRPVDFLCSFCPSVPVLSQASLLGCYRKQGSELQRSSPSLAEKLPPSSPGVWSWSGSSDPQLTQISCLRGGSCAGRLNWPSFPWGDPAAFGAWRSAADWTRCCYLPPAELKHMTGRIRPCSVTKYIVAWHFSTK